MLCFIICFLNFGICNTIYVILSVSKILWMDKRAFEKIFAFCVSVES